MDRSTTSVPAYYAKVLENFEIIARNVLRNHNLDESLVDELLRRVQTKIYNGGTLNHLPLSWIDNSKVFSRIPIERPPKYHHRSVQKESFSKSSTLKNSKVPVSLRKQEQRIEKISQHPSNNESELFDYQRIQNSKALQKKVSLSPRVMKKRNKILPQFDGRDADEVSLEGELMSDSDSDSLSSISNSERRMFNDNFDDDISDYSDEPENQESLSDDRDEENIDSFLTSNVGDLFSNAQNVLVCYADKIQRKNDCFLTKFKNCHLKVNNKDYIIGRLTGKIFFAGHEKKK